MWRYSENLRSLYETPALGGDEIEPDPAARARAGDIVRAARAEGRSALGEAEARELLACYGISSAEAAEAGEAGEADEAGYELLVSSAVDPDLGPVLIFGAGGRLAERACDRAFALPPLNVTLAQRMMEQTRIHQLLRGSRGRPPVDLRALELLLVRFADLIVEQPFVREVDLSPLIGAGGRVVARGARVLLHDPALAPEDLPRPAIRPYPAHYLSCASLRDGAEVTIRPLCPEDEALMVRFHETLSERSVRLRYMQWLRLDQRIGHERLIRVCFNDYDRELALAAVHRDPATRRCEIVGVARLAKAPGQREAEFALLVSDPWQGRGLGTALLRRLLEVARAEGLTRVTASILPENHEMQRICQKLGFRLRRGIEDPEVDAVLDLEAPGQAAA